MEVPRPSRNLNILLIEKNYIIILLICQTLFQQYALQVHVFIFHQYMAHLNIIYNLNFRKKYNSHQNTISIFLDIDFFRYARYTLISKKNKAHIQFCFSHTIIEIINYIGILTYQEDS